MQNCGSRLPSRSSSPSERVNTEKLLKGNLVVVVVLLVRWLGLGNCILKPHVLSPILEPRSYACKLAANSKDAEAILVIHVRL